MKTTKGPPVIASDAVVYPVFLSLFPFFGFFSSHISRPGRADEFHRWAILAVRMRIRLFLLSVICVLTTVSTVTALDCPKYPEQSRKDWDTEVTIAVAKIGPVKGAELKTKVENATRDLLGKFPNADRVYLEQMMYATYCSALRDDKTITESEKAKRVKEYNDEVRKAFAGQPPAKRDQEPTGAKKTKPDGKYSIDGATAISKYTRADLDKLTRTLGIEKFDLSIDDPLLDEYYVIRLHIRNGGATLEQPLTLAIFTGTEHSKILSLQHRVLSPRNKAVKIVHSIPAVQWVWPESGVKGKLTWEYVPSGEERIGFNIYRSLLREAGYGRVNPTLITAANWEMVEKARSELFPAYYKLSAINELGLESDLGEPFKVQNLTPFASFVKKGPPQKETIGVSPTLNSNPLDEAQWAFAHGRVSITFTNGLDADAEIEVYVLCKVLPGSGLAPSVALIGSPSVGFRLRGKTPSLRSASVRFQADRQKAALTPIAVKYYASSQSIYLAWEKPKAKEFAGVRIFRTRERQLGDLQALTQEQEIYDGPGLCGTTELTLPKITKVFVAVPSTKSEGTLRFLGPPPRPKPVPHSIANDSKEQGRPSSPMLLSVYLSVSLDNDYYVDTPAERGTFTYVIYGYSENGNMSYPVLVNAALAELDEGVKERVTKKEDSIGGDRK